MLLNKLNGKIYIGQTTRPVEKRFRNHQYKNSKCSAIYNAIKKYGWDNFEKDWYECPDEDLNFDEELLVREMETLAPNGYNLREGGGSNGKLSEETKQKLSKAHQGDKSYWYGKTQSVESNRKRSESLKGDKHHMYGKKHTEETKQKIGEASVGRVHTEQIKKQIGEATMGEKNHNSKRVYQYDLDGILIRSFGSSREGARHLGRRDGSKISMCARGELNTAYRFKWSYI